ncbi:MAG TPA: hypothetical protein VHA09_04100 [Nitrososphaera sp.]|nr:hypothetical protein [Nitrososphaera sp.]
MIEAIGYVAAGFIVTLAAMQVAWTMAKRATAPVIHATATRVK